VGSRDESRRAPDGRQPLDGLEPLYLLLKSYRCKQLRNYIHHHHLLLLSPKADTHFTIPLGVEG